MHLTLLFYTSDSLWGCAFQCLLASWKPPHNSPACPIFLFSICRSYFKSRVVVQPLTYVQLLVTTWTAVHQASWSCTISLSLPRFMPIESVMLSNRLILCCPFLVLPSAFPSVRVSQLFASGGQSIGASALTSVLPMSIQSWFPLGLTDLISLLSKGPSRVFSSTTVQKH